jgi:hypothetical protein
MEEVSSPLSVLQVAREDDQMVLLVGAAGDYLFLYQVLRIDNSNQFTPLFLRRYTENNTNKLSVNKPITRRLRKLISNIDRSKLDILVGTAVQNVFQV